MNKGTVKRELIGNEGMVLLDTIRRLNRRNAVDRLIKLLNKTHPADIAWVFRHLNPEERVTIFNIVAQTAAIGDVLSELDQAIMLSLVDNLTPKFMVAVFKEMASDDAADILEVLPEELANEIRQLMAREDREEVDELLQYHPESAGGLMSPDFMALDAELTVGDAINKVQERSEETEMSFYLYITHGDDEHLFGVLSLRELLMHPPYRQLKNIMNPKVIAVATDTDQEEVAHIVSQYNILAVPVVDASYKLIGIVTVDDIIDVIREEATEDFLQMAGAGKDREILLKSTWSNAMTRAPWLFASWIGGVLAAMIISVFEYELQKVIALAAFIPVVMVISEPSPVPLLFVVWPLAGLICRPFPRLFSRNCGLVFFWVRSMVSSWALLPFFPIMILFNWGWWWGLLYCLPWLWPPRWVPLSLWFLSGLT